jgi:hypothetical protein
LVERFRGFKKASVRATVFPPGDADLDAPGRHLAVLLLAHEVQLGGADVAVAGELTDLVHLRPVAVGLSSWPPVYKPVQTPGAAAPVPKGEKKKPTWVAKLGLVGFEELIEQTDLPKKLVRKLVQKGQLPCTRVGPKHYFDVQAVLEVWHARITSRDVRGSRLR